MRRLYVLVMACAAVAVTSPLGARGGAPQAGVASPSPVASHRSFVAQHCTGCHNTRARIAGLALDGMDFERIETAAPVWEKVVAKLRTGAMPPAGRPRPSAGAQQALISWLEGELDRAAAAAPDPGRPTIHRLNRTEYGHAIRDLLSLEVDVSALLPPDDSGYGFDNNADTLTFSPGLLERYLSAARKISRLAVGDPTLRPVADTYQISALLAQDDQTSEELPFGSRGGVAVRHYFPLDGEYLLRIRLQRVPASGAIRGLRTEPQQIDVRLDGARIKTFSIGGPSTRAEARDDQSYQADEADAGLIVRFAAKAGRRVLGVSLLKTSWLIEGMGPTRMPVWTFAAGRAVEKLGIDSVQVEGPYDATGPGETPSRTRIFTCGPRTTGDAELCARSILASLARRAYRRPVTATDVDRLLAYYTAGAEDRGFEGGIQAALEAVLVDPEFLFRIEREPANPPSTAYRLSDIELASRLSFFLWSSIPDDELLDEASAGRLRDPAILERQVRRMLADQRSSALVTNFAAQWLHLREILAATPYVNGFPEFDDNLREAFLRETELFIDSQLREDRSLAELLTANYTFANERLARHYGIPDVYGPRFRRVTYADDRRGGLLGHGSILTATSYSTRTSPVIRGKWVLDNILGAPPPPPPPDVPALPDAGDRGQPASVRERLERHRGNPACAACHARMDPLGFALENLDAIGRWRDSEGTQRIDASAVMPDGEKFSGPTELRRLLAARREEFANTITSKLLTYALGRGLEHYDMPSVRAIVRSAAADDYRWSSIVLGVARSVPFQMRRSEP
jgi:mono/diheme cytochrome c family protein